MYPSPVRASLLLVLTFVIAASCHAQGEVEKNTEERRALRMKLMRDRVDALEAVDTDGNPMVFAKEAAMRYNDLPRGVIDASVWMLGEKGRPAAVLVLEFYDTTSNSFMYELTANDTPPKSVTSEDWKWEPGTYSFKWTPIPVKAKPGATSRVRQSQLKLLVKDFGATEFFNGQTHQLRVLPKPIYEYQQPDIGVLSGAVFVVTNGTNTEILLFVEARAETKEHPAEWVAGFSRVATAKLDVTYEGKPFWSDERSEENGPGRPDPAALAYFSRGSNKSPEEAMAFQGEE